MEKELDKFGKIWSYRIVDSSFSVHTRLYKLHNALYHLEKTTFTLLKNNIITTPIVIIATLSYLTVLYMQIADVELSLEFLKPLIIIALFFFLIFCYQIVGALKIEKELKIIKSEIKGEHLEKWPDYLFDEASKWATRISMATEILNDIEKIPMAERDEMFESTKRNFTTIIKYSMDNLNDILENCDKLSDEYRKDSTTIENICGNYINKGKTTLNSIFDDSIKEGD